MKIKILTQKILRKTSFNFFKLFVSLFIEVKITIHMVGIQIGGESHFSVQPIKFIYFGKCLFSDTNNIK